MTQPSLAENESPRRSRTRRRETMLNAVATILGCLALVVMIATVVRVAMVKLWESAKVNPEYVQSVYDGAYEHRMKDGGPAASTPGLLDSAAAAGSGEVSRETAAAPASQEAEALHAPAAGTPVLAASGIKDMESKRPQIEAALRGFFEARSVAAKLGYVRDAGRVAPLMVQFHEHVPLVVRPWKELGWVLPVEEPGFRLGYAQAILAEGEPASLIIEEMEDATFRVDWESSVRYGELGWNEFLQTRPTVPKLFRVIASRPRHAAAGEAPQGSELLEIKHPDDDSVIYAYFDRLDPKFRSLLQQLQTGNWKDVPLTLRLCYAASSDKSDSVRIAAVEGKGWLILQGTRS